VNISEDDARKGIKGVGMSDWHTNILLELLKLSRDGYLLNISRAVEEVIGKRPIHLLSSKYVHLHHRSISSK
jgi:hypothetical protein